jgi:hypothetical protein
VTISNEQWMPLKLIRDLNSPLVILITAVNQGNDGESMNENPARHAFLR